MAYDGTLNFNTAIDTKGFTSTLGRLGATVGKSLLAAGAAIVGLGTAAVRTGAEFDSAMANVQAISGASGEEFDRLRAKALEMAAGTKFSTTEAAEALSYMGMAGWDTEQMIAGLPGVMNLAAASGADLATTSDIVTDALTALNMEASESGHFADILAAASSNSNTNVEMMGETFKYCAAMAGSLHYEADDLAVAIGLMANAGIKGSMAGTSLNMMMTRLSTNVNGAADACKELGIEFYTEEGAARPLIDVIEEMRAATADMTDQQKAEFAQTVAGTSAKKGLLAILNASEEDYNQLSEAIANCTDEETGFSAAANMAATQLDNLAGDITLMKGELSVLAVEVSDTLKGPLRGAVSFARELIGDLTDAVEKDGLQGLVSAMGTVLSKIVTKIAEYGPQIIKGATELIHSFCEGLKNTEGIGEAGAELIKALITGLISVGADLISTAAFLCAELISGLVQKLPEIAAVGIDMLHSLADSIRQNLPEMIASAVSTINEFVRGLSENLGPILEAGFDVITALAGALIDAIPVLIETLPEIITNIVKIITNNAPKLAKAGVQLIFELAKGLIKAIPTLVKEIPNIIKAVVEIFTSFGSVWLEIGEAIIEGIGDGIESLAELIPSDVKAIANDVVKIFSELPGRIWVWLQNIITNAISWGVQIKATLSEAANNAINAVIEWFSQLPGRVWTWLQNVITDVIAWGAQVLSTASSAASGAVTAVIEWFSQLPARVWTWLQNVITNLTTFGANMRSKAVSAAQGFVSSLVSGLASLPGKMYEIGSNIVQGIWNGISSGWSWLTSAVSNLANQLLQSAKNALGIESPSKEFEEQLGRWIPPGIGKGIEKAMPALLDQMDDDMDALAERMKSKVDLETGGITVRHKSDGEHKAATDSVVGGNTYVEEKFEQHNEYHVPVATPSEVSKTQREAARKLLGGVK